MREAACFGYKFKILQLIIQGQIEKRKVLQEEEERTGFKTLRGAGSSRLAYKNCLQTQNTA